MRKSFAFTMAVATIGLFASGSWAATIDLGAHSASEIKSACDKAGGSFAIQPGGSNFTCGKSNCDGKGGTCGVTCTKGGQECTGETPEHVVLPHDKRNLLGILTVAPPKSAGSPGGGLLDTTPGGSPQGPSGMGTPKPAAPPPVRLQ